MPRTLKDQLEQEYRISTGLSPLPSENPSDQAYLVRILHQNGKLADALSHLLPGDPFQLAKSFIFLGQLEEAKNILFPLMKYNDHDEVLLGEIELELARISLYEGEWSQCVSWVRSSLSRTPSIVSQMTLWQLEAAAVGEAGDAIAALKIIDRIEALGERFPGGNVLFFALNQRAKLKSRMNRMVESRSELTALWQKYLCAIKHEFSPDVLLTLARAELERNTITENDGTPWAFAALKGSQETGNELLGGMILSEWAHNQQQFGKNLPSWAVQKLSESALRFRRVRTFLERNQISITAPKAVDESKSFSMTHFVIKSLGLILSFSKKSYFKIEPESATMKFLELVAKGPQEHSSIFTHVYGGLKYSEPRHLGTLKALYSRVRKQTGLDIISDSGMVQIKCKVVVAEMIP
jgi:tetratricopeptide (TPR) repeat protein